MSLANRKSIDLQKRAQHISIEIQELFDSYIAQYYSPTVSISSLIPIASCVFEARLDPGFWSIRLKALLTALGSSQEEFSTVKDVTISSIRRGVQPEYSDSVGTIPALKTVDVQNRRVDWTACRRVTEEFFKNHPRARLHYGDIVVTSSGEGSWGRAAICDTERAVADSHLTVLKIDEDIVDPYSVLAFLWSEYGRMQFEQRVRGSTGQTEIYPRDIEKIKVLIPSISDQMLIRDKIEKQFDLIEKAEETRQQVIQEIEYCLGETQ